jgi:FlaG/FlaF family flagellin (archaellin)
VWDRFYAFDRIWARARVVRSVRARLAFVLISKLYRQMYANTGIATDSARHARSARIARLLARPCRRLFAACPMPELEMPRVEPPSRSRAQSVVASAVLAIALTVGLTPTLAAAGAERGNVPTVTAAVPGESLPIVRSQAYRMAGRIRPLMFWFGRDRVGLARISWRENTTGAVGYEFLVGTDAAIAPRGLNRWGYIAEERSAQAGSLFAIMSRSDEASFGEVKSNVERASSGGDFRAISAHVRDGSATSRLVRVVTPADLTIRDLPILLQQAHTETAAAATRAINVPGDVRPGFLTAVAEIVNQQLRTTRGSGTAGVAVPYVFGLRLFTVRQAAVHLVDDWRDGARQVARVADAEFDITTLATGEHTRFSMAYGTQGPWAGVPLLIQWQPRWWLKVELHLEDATPSAA